MKQLSDLQWVGMATSTDETRYNITEVYRDKNCIVATDGHRLHMSSGLPDLEPHFLSGLDGQFPDYKNVFPKECKGTAIIANTDDYKKPLTALVKLIKSTGAKMSVVKITPDKGKLILKYSEPFMGLSGQVEIAAEIEGGIPTIGVDLSYLIDALSMAQGTNLPVEMKFNTELSPMRLECDKRTAIVMPMRFE